MVESKNSGLNYVIESDQRYGSFTRWLAARSRRNLVQQQSRQQEEVKQILKADGSIDFESIIREPNGVGGLSLKDRLILDKPKIVLLLNGIINPQDIVQVSPFLESLGMKLLRIRQKARDRVAHAYNNMEIGDTIPHYIANTVRSIQRDLFDSADCLVIVVRNSTALDFRETVSYGGANTVLVVGGHGDLNSVLMTDGKVKNEDIPTPSEPLRAFVQHTCAKPVEGEEMGERWSEQVFGWTRATNPTDFIDNPLILRRR